MVKSESAFPEMNFFVGLEKKLSNCQNTSMFHTTLEAFVSAEMNNPF